MYKKMVCWVSALVMTGCCVSVVAEVLPASGSISIQSMFKGTSMTKFNDEYSHGTISGVIFNKAGEGPLHLGKAACSFSSFSHKEINKVIGFCAFEDKGGDKIFVQYAGDSTQKGEFNGINDIIGGTGKFKKIQGKGVAACANTDKESAFPCTETFDYQLPE